jgi:hypothetical protein
MPYRRPIGSDCSVLQAVGARSSGAFTMRRDVPVLAANAAQIDPRPEPDRLLQHAPNQPAATSLLENDRGSRRTHGSRPRFARLHASIAECPMEWAWQYPPSVVIDPGERERRAGSPLNAGRFARGPWLGGVAFALFAAGVIYAVAMVRSGWPPAGEVRPAAALTAAYQSGADRLGSAEALVSAPAGPEPSATGTAFPAASPAPVLEIALLGPVLASAGEAEEVAAKLPMRNAAVPAAAVEARGGRVLNEPPRPIFKPTLVSAADGDRSGAHARR